MGPPLVCLLSPKHAPQRDIKRKVGTLKHTLSDAHTNGNKQARQTHTHHTQKQKKKERKIHTEIYVETETRASRAITQRPPL